MIPAHEALERLREGNLRFSQGSCDGAEIASETRRLATVERQDPFAIVLGCSDSRVPAEIVFGQGVGDLFVIRVAGNIVAPSQIASVEFAAEHFGTRLVVVLGHSNCGAVVATFEAVMGAAAEPSENMHAIVDRIRPVVEPLAKTEPLDDPRAVLDKAVRANVRASVWALRNGSPRLESLVATDGLVVVGAEYSLETGLVDFFDHPAARDTL